MRGVVLIMLAMLLTGCTAGNPWRDAYVAILPVPQAASAAVGRAPSVMLADYSEISHESDLSGYEAIGYSTFTGMMHSGRERELARFAREIGSEHVVWGLQLLHVESRTSLQPVSEWSDTRSRGRIYNPATGRYDQRFRGTHRTHTTAYVPVIEDRAYYAFRAVFYRSLTGR